MRIYLAGPAGAGKSTAAGILSGRFGFHVYRLSDILRDRGHRPDRTWLQAYGDRLRATFGNAVLAMIAHQAVITDELLTGTDIDAVIDGVRLPEEAEYLRSQGYRGVRIDAPDELRRQRRSLTDAERQHYTELAACSVPADVVIENTGTVMDLAFLIRHRLKLRPLVEAEKRR